MTSANILSVDYDAVTSKMTITFMSLGKYVYYDVPYNVYDDLLQSKKKTETFNTKVKGQYREKQIL